MVKNDPEYLLMRKSNIKYKFYLCSEKRGWQLGKWKINIFNLYELLK